MDQRPLFSYGSKILPTAATGDLPEIQDVSVVYQGKQENILREDALEKWREIKDDVVIVPVKIHGFKRYYSNESPRGGAMLEVFEDEDGFVNGVLYYNLPREIRDAVDVKEEDMGGYKRVAVKADKIETYLDENRMEDLGVELPEKIDLYVPREDSDKSNLDTERTKNEVYHARIMKGIDLLGRLYGGELAEQFREDFLETTYEYSPSRHDFAPLQ